MVTLSFSFMSYERKFYIKDIFYIYYFYFLFFLYLHILQEI